MSLLQLNNQNLSSIHRGITCPNYNRSKIKTGIVHIGVGGFHRSHQAYYIHQLLADNQNTEWGICGIGLREADKNIAHVFEKQNCLYTLITQHPDGKENCEVIGSMVDYIFAIDEPNMAIEKMAAPETKIVSLTITEGGYNFNPNNGAFNFDNPDIQYELQHPDKPKTVFGFITNALKKRKEAGLPAFTILSCDNIQHNGDVARKMLLTYIERLDHNLYAWVKEKVNFPNSMVDRITPVTPKSSIDFLKENYQLNDAWPVVCEPYIQWVIEDTFSNGKPPLEELGVQFVKDVTPYEKMKIRLLNAGHSALGIPGAVHGHATINQCMEDQILASFMRGFMDKEATPILGVIEGIDLTEYKNSLEERFANPNIKDGVSRICSESSAKLPKFLIPTLHENLATGGSIRYATFILATWAYYSHKGMNFKNQEIEIIDERKEELHEAAKQFNQDEFSFLGIPDIFGKLIENQRFKNEYSQMIQAIYEKQNIHDLMSQILKAAD